MTVTHMHKPYLGTKTREEKNHSSDGIKPFSTIMLSLPRRTAMGSQSGIDQSLHKPLLHETQTTYL